MLILPFTRNHRFLNCKYIPSLPNKFSRTRLEAPRLFRSGGGGGRAGCRGGGGGVGGGGGGEGGGVGRGGGSGGGGRGFYNQKAPYTSR